MPIPEMMAPRSTIDMICQNLREAIYAAAMADSPRIAPPLSDAARPFWTGGGEGSLLILYCDGCDRWVHPPDDGCPTCAGPLAPRRASGLGTVFTFTVNHHPYNPAVPLPYVIAIVELVEQPGLRFTTNVVDCDPDHVRIGMPVEVTFEAAGDAWAPVFRPYAGIVDAA
jgi:uncharacterized protein